MEHHPIAYLKNLQTNGRPRDSVLFHRKRLERFESLYFQDLTAHYGCVNALEFSNGAGNFLASGGDDKRVVVWNVTLAMLRQRYRPLQMGATHLSNIFCLAFSQTNDHLISSGNDGQVIVHDLQTSRLVDVFMCDSSVYGLSTSPVHENHVASACEDGTVHIIDTRLSKADSLCLARRQSAFHSVMFSPVDHHLIVTSHSRDGMALWDIRSPKKEVLHYGEKSTKQRAMSARFNKTGNQLICLRRRQPLALFNINNSRSIAEFESEGYSNSCTMKSCCFAGDKDQYIVSGSDDFGVYIWKLPEDYRKPSLFIGSAYKILRGHRSIVNQVRFNPHSNLLVSCGVEKMVKLWSTEHLPHGSGDVKPDCDLPRKRYSHNEYIQLILESRSAMVDDYYTENTAEDPKMLAFFDSLIQHEADEHDSNSSNSDRETTIVAQRNHYFATGGGIDTEPNSSSTDESVEGPASLETLGIVGDSAESSGVSQVAQKKLQKLRAVINEESDWRVRDIMSQPTSVVAEAKEETNKSSTLRTKRRKKENERAFKQPNDSSDSEEEATRMRQRNARRRFRKHTKVMQQSSDDATPSTSGLHSTKCDGDAKSALYSTPNDESSRSN